VREGGRTGGPDGSDGASPRQSHRPDSWLSLLIGIASGSGGFEISIDPLLVGAEHTSM
jgi:hypothetical protein